MNQIPAKPTSHSTLPAAAVAEFQSEFGGAIIRSGSAEYENARKVWNAIIDRYPAIIAMCEDVEDVVKAVRFARDHHLPLSVRSGGHNVAGRALCDDGIVVDLSRMKAITVDADRNIVEVQATAEKTPFSEEQFLTLLSLARKGIGKLVDLQKMAVT